MADRVGCAFDCVALLACSFAIRCPFTPDAGGSKGGRKMGKRVVYNKEKGRGVKGVLLRIVFEI